MYVCYLENIMMSPVRILNFLIFTYCAFGLEEGVNDLVNVDCVKVGDSVTLHTGLNQIEPDGLIEWRFGQDLSARINSKSNNKTLNLYGINRNRLKLDNQTGDLKITNVKSTDAGCYKFRINNLKGQSSKTFNITCVIEPSDEQKVVSVLDRDSVILSSGLYNVTSDDRITWRFEGMIIAQMNPISRPVYDDVLDGRFAKRLRLVLENGSLIITNVRPQISGPYELGITKISKGFTTHKTVIVTAMDGGNTLSVLEGNSVTLESGLHKIYIDDVITWRFEDEDSVIANISNGSFTTSDGADGRFRARLELDDKTGSLTIKNIKTTHAGLYHLDITGNRRTIFKRFNISVCAWVWSLRVFTGICVFFLLGFFAAIAVIYCGNKICHQKERLCEFCPEVKNKFLNCNIK